MYELVRAGRLRSTATSNMKSAILPTRDTPAGIISAAGCACRTWSSALCAAHGFFEDCRIMNPANLDTYLAGDEPKREPVSKRNCTLQKHDAGPAHDARRQG